MVHRRTYGRERDWEHRSNVAQPNSRVLDSSLPQQFARPSAHDGANEVWRRGRGRPPSLHHLTGAHGRGASRGQGSGSEHRFRGQLPAQRFAHHILPATPWQRGDRRPGFFTSHGPQAGIHLAPRLSPAQPLPRPTKKTTDPSLPPSALRLSSTDEVYDTDSVQWAATSRSSRPQPRPGAHAGRAAAHAAVLRNFRTKRKTMAVMTPGVRRVAISHLSSSSSEDSEAESTSGSEDDSNRRDEPVGDGSAVDSSDTDDSKSSTSEDEPQIPSLAVTPAQPILPDRIFTRRTLTAGSDNKLIRGQPWKSIEDVDSEFIRMRQVLNSTTIIASVSDPPGTSRVRQSAGTGAPSLPALLRRDLKQFSLPLYTLERLRRLPFLRRNLRVGFVDYCDALGIPTLFSPRVLAPGEARAGHDQYAIFELWSRPPVDAPLRPGEDHRVRQTMKLNIGREGWACPLCELHGEFPDREMLQLHLRLSHPECHVTWEERSEQSTANWDWRIILEFSDSGRLREDTDLQGPKTDFFYLRLMGRPGSIVWRRQRSQSPSYMVRSPGQTPTPSSPPITSRSAHSSLSLLKPKLEPAQAWRDISTSSSSSSIPLGVRIREETPFENQLDLRSFTVADAPEGGLGPIARTPDRVLGFMSAQHKLQVSSNPAGLKLYDLLELLDTTRYGVLAWYIFEKDLEIFDYDCRDEDKVVLCLWSRWIFYDRANFIRDSKLSVMEWINDAEYGWMLGLACGADALQEWLFVLFEYRYLQAHDVPEIMRHYQNRVARCEYVWDPAYASGYEGSWNIA